MAYVHTVTSKGIATIEFFHPSHNALPGDILRQLAESIQATGDDPQVNVIILRSGGDRTFCAGASFDELMSIKTAAEGLQFFKGFADVINACRKCSKLIIGRVQGKAVGGGVGLAAATDYCFATKYAAIKLSELAIGIGPFVIGPAVRRKMGLSAFSQLAINAYEWQNAYWAKDKGLYTEVFDTAESMDKAIELLADRLANAGPQATEQLKKVLWEGTQHWDQLLEDRAKISGQLVLSDITKEILARIKSR